MDPTGTTEFLRPSEVSGRTADDVMNTLSRFAERHDRQVISWYHDQPIWLIGPIQVALVRSRRDIRVEVHNGDIGQQSFTLMPGTLQADLERALCELVVLGWAEE